MEKSQHSRKYRKLLAALRAARQRLGFTQAEVTAKLRTYDSFVSKMESGERRLDVVELAALCRLYELDLVELLRSTGIYK
jgi:transcriptional regulator with XRE-family HTH domain